ncbi:MULTISPECIES: hypothetical protein [unclassified Novosphingobium]|uniref:hypothetical protein n=1 Tax=unclassified Novosphingobium TaxID=2644732 RepID=UPI00135A1248|nr:MULTISPECIES: hypothetical protein [unclassified Novosphingobium]
MRLSKDRQTTSAVIRIGKVFSMEARTDFSPVGLVAAGLLVSGILLSSAVIVAAGRRRFMGRIEG